MKETFLTGACVALLTLGLTSCKTDPKTEADEKVEVAEENLQDAKKAASAAEWKEFREKTDAMIDENKIQISELKSKMNKAKVSMDSDYARNIAELERKNDALKASLENYKNDRKSDWESFKREFNHDAEELGSAIKDFTINNKK